MAERSSRRMKHSQTKYSSSQNLTGHTNPLQNKPPNFQQISNRSVPTSFQQAGSSQLHNPDEYSSEEFSSSEESSSSEEDSIDPRTMVSVIAIGNPGAGKSTILNSLAGEILFKSGVSIASGLTYQLEEKMNKKGRFFDTPGLADDTLREAAARAISTALGRGGPFKILFFVRLEAGRIIREDITTLKLVLESAPEIGNKYGIVTNKLPREVIEILQDPNELEKLLIKLFSSIPEEKRCSLASITYLPYSRQADSKPDHLLPPNSLETPGGLYFADFVYKQIETVQLTEGLAKDIKIGDWEETTNAIDIVEKKLDENSKMLREQQRWMRKQLKKAEKEVLKKHKELAASHAELAEYHKRDREKLQRKKEACKLM